MLAAAVPLAAGETSFAAARSAASAGDAKNGVAGAMLLRLTAPAYADGIAAPAGAGRPNARALSNALAAESAPIPNDRGVSDLFWLWGQFLDHDLDLTDTAEPAEPFDIRVPTGDPWFDPAGTGAAVIPLNRSAWDPSTGWAAGVPRQQINRITARIDASNVYGSDAARAMALRTLDGTGRLRTSRGDLLPFNDLGLPNAGGPSPALYLAGDVRANEHVALTAMHTLWVREHNRRARSIAKAEPGLDGDAIYWRARARVVAEIQVIAFQEFLPLLIGRLALPRYEGFDPGVDPGICQEFSAAAYRFGHSMIPDRLLRIDAQGAPIPEGHLPLENAFFAPGELTPRIGIEPYLRGMTERPARRIDTRVADSLRNFLFGPPGAGGFDLVALNIQRGRDHGLMDLNGVRASLGLRRFVDVSEISFDPGVVVELRRVYGDVHDIDLWVGGLAEIHAPGSMVGTTFHAILVDQFTRLRDGDPNFYRALYSGGELRELERTTLAKIIRRNTEIGRELPRKALLVAAD